MFFFCILWPHIPAIVSVKFVLITSLCKCSISAVKCWYSPRHPRQTRRQPSYEIITSESDGILKRAWQLASDWWKRAELWLLTQCETSPWVNHKTSGEVEVEAVSGVSALMNEKMESLADHCPLSWGEVTGQKVVLQWEMTPGWCRLRLGNYRAYCICCHYRVPTGNGVSLFVFLTHNSVSWPL